MDNTSRRYAYLKKIIGEYERSHSKAFPMSWGVDEQLCLRFCTDTKKDLSMILSKTEKIDVQQMIKALKETGQLELQLSKNFTVL